MKKSLSRAILSLGVAAMMSGAAFAADDGARDTKPSDWPSKYVWHKYDKTAPQPVWKGPVRTYVNKSLGDGVRFDSLPLQHAIVRVRGTGKHKIAVFVDPLCPYSRQYERQVNKLDNVTIYTFVVPLLNKTPTSKNAKMTERILCGPSNQARAQAYEAWIVAGISPPQVTGCATAIKDVLQSLKGAKTDKGLPYDTLSPFTVYEGLDMAAPGALPMDLVQKFLEFKY